MVFGVKPIGLYKTSILSKASNKIEVFEHSFMKRRITSELIFVPVLLSILLLSNCYGKMKVGFLDQ